MSAEQMSAIADVIRGRRTIHDFREELPPSELIEQAISLAVWAPNHKHTEPWRFYWLGPEAKRAVVDLNAEIVAEQKGAVAGEAKRKRWSTVPGWIAVTCAITNDPIRDREDYAACCCAIQNLSLALWSRGVGVKWTTGPVTRHPRFLEILETTEAESRVVGLLWYGYPESVPETKRKPPTEVTRRLP